MYAMILLLLWCKAHSLTMLLGALLAVVWLLMLRAWAEQPLPWSVWGVGVAIGIAYALRLSAP